MPATASSRALLYVEESVRVGASIQVSVRRGRRLRQPQRCGSASAGSSSGQGCSRFSTSRRHACGCSSLRLGTGRPPWPSSGSLATVGRPRGTPLARRPPTSPPSRSESLSARPRSSKSATFGCAHTCARCRLPPRTSRRLLRSSVRTWRRGLRTRGLSSTTTTRSRRSRSAEAFVHALVSASPVQFLVASRVRPSWVTTKDRLYGEALEVSQTALAMDTKEAADVLVERSEDSASGLVALANGWPAVIGLASVSSAEIEDGVESRSGVALSVLRRRGVRRPWRRGKARSDDACGRSCHRRRARSCAARRDVERQSPRPLLTLASWSSATRGSTCTRSRAHSSRRRAASSAYVPPTTPRRSVLRSIASGASGMRPST